MYVSGKSLHIGGRYVRRGALPTLIRYTRGTRPAQRSCASSGEFSVVRRVRPLTARYLWPSLSTQGLDSVEHHIGSVPCALMSFVYVSMCRSNEQSPRVPAQR